MAICCKSCSMRNTQTRANPASRKQLREMLTMFSNPVFSQLVAARERFVTSANSFTHNTPNLHTFGEGVATFGEGAYTPKLLISSSSSSSAAAAASNLLSNNLQSSLSTCCIQFAEHSVQCILQSSLSTARERAPLLCGAYDIILSKNERRI
jgi:hypothetical protein